MVQESEHAWYSLGIDQVFELLGSGEQGLTEKEAQKRLKRYGANTLQLRNAETISTILLRQLLNPIVYVLIFSTVLAFSLGKFTDGFVVLSVIILNTLIGFIQEHRAYQTIRALTSMVPNDTMVIRNGNAKMINSSQLVPGDIVMLQAGDRIAADLRLFSIKNLQCDESILTGESLPVNKRNEAVSADTPLVEQKCMVFNGTYVTAGAGLGIVIATGLKTEFGKIAELIENVTPLETPMSITIKKIAWWITTIVLTVSAGLFLIGYLRGNSLFDSAFAAITLAVAAIPEGLPAIITITSSIGVRRMANKKAIIRQLPAVEALGSTSIICTDKTGTLTYNEMTLQKIWTKAGITFISGAGYSLEGEFSSPGGQSKEEIENLLIAGVLCNDASIDEDPNGWVPVGDPTEIALVVAGRKMGFCEAKLREEWKRRDVIPFESERRLMATLNISPLGEKYIFIKGAPEDILALCDDVSDANQIYSQIQSMAKNGMRVLGIAKKEVETNIQELKEEDIKNGFSFLGLVGMIDLPRKEVYQALRSCHEAGINVKMITGDHPLTAEAISRDLNILGSGKVVTGAELDKFDAHRWKEAANEVQVFARVSPEHKLKLVQVLQEGGHVVAMTGDGVNDAAALKRADIGIAMGIKGTAVSKEAADMILADDNFANIEEAVKEGRQVYDNLIKSLAFVLTTSLGQAMVILLAILFFPIHNGVTLHPMSPVQILWVNLVVAVALSIPLAFESAEENIMKRPPRKKKTPVLNSFLLAKIFIVSTLMAISTISLFLWEYHTQIENGSPERIAISEGQTMAVTAIIFVQIFYLFNCRTLDHSMVKNFFSNRFIFIGVAVVLAAQLAFVHSPLMNKLFQTSPLNLNAWMISALVAFSIVPILAIEKYIYRT